MDMFSRGLRFYRSSVLEATEHGLPVFTHGQIETGRSDFDVIFRCLYAVWQPLYVLCERGRFNENTEPDDVFASVLWVNEHSNLELHHAEVLARSGCYMEEFDSSTLLLFSEPPPKSLSWTSYLAMCGHGVRVYPAGLVAVLNNFDGIYWEFYAADAPSLNRLLMQHCRNVPGCSFATDCNEFPRPATVSALSRIALTLYWVEFGVDFPYSRPADLVQACFAFAKLETRAC
jgi:hypothetical protein